MITSSIEDFEWSERGEELRLVLANEPYLTVDGQGKTLLPGLEIIIGEKRETWKVSAGLDSSHIFSAWRSRHKKLCSVRNPFLSHCPLEAKRRKLEVNEYKTAYSKPIANAKRAESLAVEEAERIITRITLRQKSEPTQIEIAFYEAEIHAARVTSARLAKLLSDKTLEAIAIRKAARIAPTMQTFAAQASKSIEIREAEYIVFVEVCRVARSSRHDAQVVANRAKLLRQQELQQKFIISLAQKGLGQGCIRQTQLTYLVQKAPPLAGLKPTPTSVGLFLSFLFVVVHFWTKPKDE
jgi:hypothetical protein